MFLVFTLVLLVVAVGILASVYSIFFPFMQNLGTANQYHMAYYGAISAVERAELGLKYKMPGFQGSGGFFGTTGFGPMSDYTPDLLSDNQHGFRRTVDSRTMSIPGSGMGDIDPMFAATDSKDYNALGYTDLETFILSYDGTIDPQSYYTGTADPVFFSGDSINGVFRLPPKISTAFGGSPAASLCDSDVGDCDANGDGVSDDIAVSRSLAGLYKGNIFVISPIASIFETGGLRYIDEPMDNGIRESIINETGTIAFENSFTPVAPHGSNLTGHNITYIVVPADTLDIASKDFSQILSDTTDFSGLSLSLGAADLFRTFTGAIYPYLEYQFTFPQPVADRFYTIEGHGRVGEYDVQILLKKPTTQGTVGGDFAIIF